MQKYAPYVIGGIVVIFLGFAGLYFMHRGAAAGASGTTITTPSQPVVMATSTFATTTYSIVYPQDFTVDQSYQYTGVPKKPIPGVKFVIPMTMATGTNLSMDSGVSVEQLPRAKNCTADIFFYDNVKPQSLTDNGVAYSVASSSDAGAGNYYEETVYALSNTHPCTAVRYFIHSTNFLNYPPGAVTEFNRAALLASYDKIRQSLVLMQ